MKFCLAKEHLEYFSKYGMLELDSIFSDIQQKEIKLLINKILDERFREGISPRMVNFNTNIHELGHDLWRQNEDLKKILFNKKISEIAKELGFQTPYRIGFDQYLTNHAPLNSSITLEDLSPFQGILFGYLLCLNPSQIQEEQSILSPFSNKSGNIVIINTQALLDFSFLMNQKGIEYLLVTYIADKSIYSYKEKALHVHYLKKFGYAFGDKISEKTNPIVYRK